MDDTLVVLGGWNVSELSSRLKFSQDQENAEKRKWPRYPIDVALRASVNSGGTTKAIYGSGIEVSKGGIKAVLPAEIAIGEWVDIELTLPYCSQALALSTIVRNRSSFTYGLEFVGITTEQQTEIERACRLLSILQ